MSAVNRLRRHRRAIVGWVSAVAVVVGVSTALVLLVDIDWSSPAVFAAAIVVVFLGAAVGVVAAGVGQTEPHPQPAAYPRAGSQCAQCSAPAARFRVDKLRFCSKACHRAWVLADKRSEG